MAAAELLHPMACELDQDSRTSRSQEAGGLASLTSVVEVRQVEISRVVDLKRASLWPEDCQWNDSSTGSW